MRKTGLMMLSRAELACCCCTQSGSVLHCFCGQLRVNSNSINNNNNIHTSINNYINSITPPAVTSQLLSVSQSSQHEVQPVPDDGESLSVQWRDSPP